MGLSPSDELHRFATHSPTSLSVPFFPVSIARSFLLNTLYIVSLRRWFFTLSVVLLEVFVSDVEVLLVPGVAFVDELSEFVTEFGLEMKFFDEFPRGILVVLILISILCIYC